MPLAPWVDHAGLPEGRPALAGGDEEWDALGALATAVLFTLSGRRWAGAATRTVQIVAVGGPAWPQGALGPDFWWDDTWGAHLSGGEIYNHACCTSPRRVRLPHYPVARVESVVIGDTARHPATYRLADRRWLEDLAGVGWPTCDPGLLVTYTAGTDPPVEAIDAARALALELGRARAGDLRCRLPSNVTAITRQGITQSFTPAAEIIKDGKTGLPEVDLWLATVNPNNRRHRPSSWSPDTHPRTYPREETP